MKSKTKKQTKEVAKNILKGIGLAAMIGGVIVFPGMAPLIKWVDDLGRENSYAGRRAFRRMRTRGLIKLDRQKKGIKIILSSKGQRQFRKYLIQDLKIIKPPHWDGKWRLVMFDIPEPNKTSRDLIRRRLLNLGFVTVQKSVFIHPYSCEKVIEILRDNYNLQTGQLYVFEASVREGEEILRKHFKL